MPATSIGVISSPARLRTSPATGPPPYQVALFPAAPAGKDVQVVQQGLMQHQPPVTVPPSETPQVSLGRFFAARGWVLLLDRAEWLFGEACADLDTSVAAERAAKWRQVRAAFTALAAYEHRLEPAVRRLARELAWRRAHPGEALPPYAPPKGKDAERGAAYRQGWDRCGCTSCQLARERVQWRPHSHVRLRTL